MIGVSELAEEGLEKFAVWQCIRVCKLPSRIPGREVRDFGTQIAISPVV
jgi:hypothetical protein